MKKKREGRRRNAGVIYSSQIQDIGLRENTTASHTAAGAPARRRVICSCGCHLPQKPLLQHHHHSTTTTHHHHQALATIAVPSCSNSGTPARTRLVNLQPSALPIYLAPAPSHLRLVLNLEQLRLHSAMPNTAGILLFWVTILNLIAKSRRIGRGMRGEKEPLALLQDCSERYKTLQITDHTFRKYACTPFEGCRVWTGLVYWTQSISGISPVSGL